MPFQINENTRGFIKEHLNDQIHNLALNKHKYQDIDIEYALQDIESRKKLKAKLPEWSDNFNLIMPKQISIQQSSSYLTAIFKANKWQAAKSIDLTGGFGVDSYFFAKKNNIHYYIEPNLELCNIVEHNFGELSINNVVFFNKSAQEFLLQIDEKFDIAYIDPSRRINSDKRAYSIEDSEPNIFELFDIIKHISDKLIVKLSPMLEISELIKQMPSVDNIYILAIDNECKELLLEFDFINTNSCKKIHSIELGKNQFHYSFEFGVDQNIDYSMPQKYIYDMSSSIFKSGYNDFFATENELAKLNKSSHIYTSDLFINKPGLKAYELLSIIKPDSKQIGLSLPSRTAIVVRKNFPLSVEQIRKKYKINEGREIVIFASTLIDGRNYFLICRKIQNKIIN